MTAKKCVHDEKVIFVSISIGYQLPDPLTCCSGAGRGGGGQHRLNIM